MKTRIGFTLVELLIALVLSTFILIGLIGVSSQMLRFEIEGSKKSINTAYTLITLDQMVKEISTGNVLITPGHPDKTQSAALSGCVDYTLNPNVPGAPGALDGNMANVKAFYYCVWDKAGGNTDPSAPWLLHYSQAGACPIAPACGSGSFDVVAQNLVPLGFTGVAANGCPDATGCSFMRDDSVGGVGLSFQIGIVPTAAQPTITYQQVNAKVPMQKAYTDTFD